VFVAAVLIGCGGGGARNDGAAGSGAAGTAGAGAAGAGGSAGGTAGATGGSGSGGTSGGVPACATATPPNDPVNPDGGYISVACNAIAFGADWVSPEVVAGTDGGVALDGGASEEPSGGSMVDGDYDLVRFRIIGIPSRRIRRSVRIFEGGTYIEWLVDNETSNGDAGVTIDEARFDSRQVFAVSPTFTLTIVCNNPGLTNSDYSYSYTATGDELVIFNYYMGRLVNIYTYRRNCAR